MQWRKYLGITNVPGCYPPSAGISPGAAVSNGVVYVGGGDSNWYALSASTGAVQWSINAGDDSPTGGH